MPKLPVFMLLAMAISVMTGCSEMPVAGPLASAVIDNGDADSPAHINYIVVNVTPDVSTTLAAQRQSSLQAVFGTGGPPPEYAVSIGDTLAVTIWETGANDLYVAPQTPNTAPSPLRGYTLPELVVGQDGRITIPYVGRVQVAGERPSQIEGDIQVRLKRKIADPQVVVTVAHSSENTVSVGGDATGGVRVPLSVAGDRVLDVISDAGGLRIPIYEAVVRLTRDGKTASVHYATILQRPEENIFLRPGDVLTIARVPRTFTAFGALGRNFQIPFEADSLSIEEALAKAGGLLDQRADPAGIFIFRYETASVVSQLVPGWKNVDNRDLVPVVYRLDMSNAGAYFLARSLEVHDRDIIYVANAKLNEVQKFLSIIGAALAPAATGATVGTSIH